MPKTIILFLFSRQFCSYIYIRIHTYIHDIRLKRRVIRKKAWKIIWTKACVDRIPVLLVPDHFRVLHNCPRFTESPSDFIAKFYDTGHSESMRLIQDIFIAQNWSELKSLPQKTDSSRIDFEIFAFKTEKTIISYRISSDVFNDQFWKIKTCKNFLQEWTLIYSKCWNKF